MEQDLEQMYLENDEKAYALLDRQMEKNRKFHFQQGHASEEEKLFRMSRKDKKDQSIYRIKLTATLQEVDIEIEPEDVTVTPMTATGPYVVALHKEAAEYILEEGVMLADSDQDPPFTQFFAAKPFNASTNDIKPSNNADDIAMSIYFNLGAEYTGLRMKDLTEPKDRIMAALIEVFGQPSDFLS
ncbi:hypothetical protein AB1Y20_022506 [Prymnesium parvum]|uniref:Uncharacterized protein n=1 Tax=Prymnesium parvum TaxID=97485 RepID=A0AB34JI68_PRYPA